MARLNRIFIALLLLVTLPAAHASGLDAVSAEESGGALRQALSQGATAAVASLGRPDGFLGNPKVKIPLPEDLQKAEKLMRKLGMGMYVEELIVTMNRAAEAILTGGDDSVTQYFRRTTSAPLTEKFLPIVRQTTERVELANKYNQGARRPVLHDCRRGARHPQKPAGPGQQSAAEGVRRTEMI